MTARLRRRSARVVENRFVLNRGAVAIARIAPVWGSMTTAVADFADQRRTVVGKNLLGVRLDLTVDREPHVLARGLLLRLDDVESAAERILDDRLTARLARECPLERPLQPFETLVVEAGEAEDLGRDRSLRVEAELLRIEPETGVAELLELLGLARIRLPLDVHEASRAVGQRRIENRRIGPEDLSDGQREVARIVDLPRIRVDRRRPASDREGLAVAVDYRPAAGRHDDRLAMLAKCHRRVLRPLDHLEPDGAAERGREKDQECGREEADPAVRRGELHFPSRR